MTAKAGSIRTNRKQGHITGKSRLVSGSSLQTVLPFRALAVSVCYTFLAGRLSFCSFFSLPAFVLSVSLLSFRLFRWQLMFILVKENGLFLSKICVYVKNPAVCSTGESPIPLLPVLKSGRGSAFHMPVRAGESVRIVVSVRPHVADSLCVSSCESVRTWL